MSDPQKQGNADNVREFPLDWRDVRLPNWALPSDEFLAIPIRDDSHESEHVIRGDLAIIHITETILPGDPIVVFTRKGDVFCYFNKDRPEGAIRGKVIRIERDL